MNKHRNLIDEFYLYAKKRLGLDPNPRLILKKDKENSNDPLGVTAYYIPGENKIIIYTTGRHIKDILRSFSHELVHCKQDQSKLFPDDLDLERGYAQRNEIMRKLEKQAYLVGNLVFRDWTDTRK